MADLILNVYVYPLQDHLHWSEYFDASFVYEIYDYVLNVIVCGDWA